MPKVIASAPNAGGRHQRGRRVGSSLAEINVIPLVDVMLVLLIIFMVAAPMLQRGVEVTLPVASRAQDLASERIFVDVPMSFSTDRRVFLGKESIRLEALQVASPGGPRVLWEGPSLPLTDVPAQAYKHVRTDAITR